MMNRYIDVDELIRKINEYECYNYDSEVSRICELINDAPTLDVEPVRHGRSKRMGDLISRQAAIDAMESISDSICEQQGIDALCELPSAQLEIIRCKDCKNYEHIITAVDNEENVTKECDFCNHWKRIIDANDYCSYGERKEHE